MTVPPPEQREERHAFLCREIERLIERHKAMPTDELKSRVGAQITEYVRELDTMEAQQRQERESALAYEPLDRPSFRSPGFYQSLGAGIICILVGALAGLSLLVLGGMIVLLITASSVAQGRSSRRRPAEPKRWDWKP